MSLLVIHSIIYELQSPYFMFKFVIRSLKITKLIQKGGGTVPCDSLATLL